MNCDDLLVMKSVLEAAIALRRDNRRGSKVEPQVYWSEPVVDMQRVLDLITKQLADIDANERGMLEIEAGDEGY